jgi:predicted SnoaL-like aldol condensation-catalyzing enzyme
MTTHQLQKNKQNAIAFYELMFNDNKPRKAIETYTGEQYIQHNPHVPDGKEGFIEYFEQMARDFPGKKVHIKRAIAEDNLVVLHTFQEWPTDQDYVTMDIFRFNENGKIVEHWDVLQTMPSEFTHNNGMF